MTRQQTGIEKLDEMLGGGLLPGTLTVVVGATGIGKTQLGVQFAHQGRTDEGKRGVLFDVCARGDSQSHAEYARRLAGWPLQIVDPEQAPLLADYYGSDRSHGDYLHVFDYRGKRVTRRDLDWDDWHSWQAQLNSKLRQAISFLYGSFVQGVRRVVIDGIEPAERPQESIQWNMCEYIYHQVLRKDPEWVARDLFREQYRQHAEVAGFHRYDPQQIGCLMLYTSHEMMLDDMIARRLDEGDALSNANTIIYMGKIPAGKSIRRAFYVGKHRGSACSDQIVEYEVTEDGIVCEQSSA